MRIIIALYVLILASLLFPVEAYAKSSKVKDGTYVGRANIKDVKCFDVGCGTRHTRRIPLAIVSANKHVTGVIIQNENKQDPSFLFTIPFNYPKALLDTTFIERGVTFTSKGRKLLYTASDESEDDVDSLSVAGKAKLKSLSKKNRFNALSSFVNKQVSEEGDACESSKFSFLNISDAGFVVGRFDLYNFEDEDWTVSFFGKIKTGKKFKTILSGETPITTAAGMPIASIKQLKPDITSITKNQNGTITISGVIDSKLFSVDFLNELCPIEE